MPPAVRSEYLCEAETNRLLSSLDRRREIHRRDGKNPNSDNNGAKRRVVPRVPGAPWYLAPAAWRKPGSGRVGSGRVGPRRSSDVRRSMSRRGHHPPSLHITSPLLVVVTRNSCDSARPAHDLPPHLTPPSLSLPRAPLSHAMARCGLNGRLAGCGWLARRPDDYRPDDYRPAVCCSWPCVTVMVTIIQDGAISCSISSPTLR